MGSETDYPPFATGMSDATAGGFTVDLWKAVAAEAGLKYSLRVRPFHQILQEFREGRIDVLINLAQSGERRRFADFTVPHAIVHGGIFVRKGEAGIRSEADFAGKSLIVLNADLAHDYAVVKGWGSQLVLVDTAAEGLRLLASGRHDAMLLSKLAGMQTLQTLGLANIEALKARAGFAQKFAFAVPKGQSELLASLNEGLALTKSEGTYNALYDKWFGVYESKEVGWRDLLKYLIPLALALSGSAGYFFYQRSRERLAAEAKLRTLYAAIEQSPAAVVIADLNSCIQYVNPKFTATTGYSAAEAAGQNPRIFRSGQTAKETYVELWGKLSSGQAWEGELLNKRKNGELYWEEVRIAPVKNPAGSVTHYVAVKVDITARKQVEEELELFRLMVEKTGDCTFMIDDDDDCRMMYVNEAAVRHYGASRAEILTWRIPDWDPNFSYDMLPQHVANIKKVKHLTIESQHRLKDGSIVPVEVSLNYVLYKGRHCHVGHFRNISDRKRLEDQVRQLAFFDTLTKLPNRRLFNDRLSQAMSASKRSGCYGAVMFLDLDNFKPLNDAHGHAVGDLLLIDAANRLKGCVREADTVARFGGDEFVVMLSELSVDQDDSRSQALSVAEKIRTTLSEPYRLTVRQAGEADASIEHRCTASIGVALFIDHAASPDDILKWADDSMYQAKDAGRNTIRIHAAKA